MYKEIVAICHTEEEYARRLADYINDHGLLPCPAASFSDKGKLTRYEKQHPVRHKVIPQDWAKHYTKEELKSGVSLFCDEEEMEEGMYVYRFRSADLVAEQICRMADFALPATKSRGKTKLIGVYSPVGRCLKTSFSLTLGQMLAQKYHVLYLNFENYSGFGKMMGMNKAVDMSDLLYYFLNLREEFHQKMDGMAFSMNGLEIIPPALSFLDLESVGEDEWERFFDTLSEKGNYDYIVLDLSDYIKGLYRILLECTYVYTFTQEDGVAMAKVEQYEKILNSLNYGEILNRTRKISPPIFRKLPIRPEELIHSELADYTRRITEDDFHWNR